MDCLDKIKAKLEECSEEEEEGCEDCPVREECAQWFTSIPHNIPQDECSRYTLKAAALRGKKRRLTDEHERQDDTGLPDLHEDDAG